MKRLGLASVVAAILIGGCVPARSVPTEPPVATSAPSVASARSQARQLSSPVELHPVGWYASVSVIDPKTRVRMKYSWHRGCPVPIKDLRLITMTYRGFDRANHVGEMVVHSSVARAVVRAFHAMYKAGYPIRRMRLIDDFRGDDDLSMAADNTSAFNCRLVTGGSSWSQHAYGWAVDINPVENPYVSAGGEVLPQAGRKYADRRSRARGVIHHGDAVWRAFQSVGWGWGGDWRSFHDYQHFSLTGR
jgi:D-alanyl-D-alanine carboxypeptidase